MRGILQHVGLIRQVSFTVPVAMDRARANLTTLLQQDIVLRGQWQLTRRYWGHLDRDRLVLHGPQANRQFCFLTCGDLSPSDNPNQTQVTLEITLSRGSEAQLWVTLAFLLTIFPILLRWFGVLLIPFQIGFIYGMTQWHFEHYTAEISALVRNSTISHDA